MRISTNFILLLFLYFFFSCKNDTASNELLRKAQSLTTNDPAKALVLLDSIRNPEKMGKDDYMQYIVARVQAKYKTYQDVTGDTLIFEAQRYFDGKNNYEQATLAHFYAGGVYREKQIPDKSLKSFLNAGYYANKTNKKPKFSGIISENIAALYFEQSLMDSAIFYYQKTLDYYKEVKDTDLSVMKITNLIGRSYEEIGKLDSAYVYFNKALQIAENLNNEKNKSSITQNLGLTSFGMGEYDKAIEYYNSALGMQATTNTQKGQIYLYLLSIYTNKQNSNSAKEYALKIEASLPNVTDLHTKEEIYAALANYYKLTSDYKQSVYFSEQEKETIQQIAIEERPVEMIKADADFRAEQKDKIYRELQSDINFYLSLGVSTVLIVVLFIIYTIKQNKKEEKYFQQEKEEYQKYKDHIEASNREYDRIDAEIKEILEDTEEEK